MIEDSTGFVQPLIITPSKKEEKVLLEHSTYCQLHTDTYL